MCRSFSVRLRLLSGHFFLERAAHSVDHIMFSLCFFFYYLLVRLFSVLIFEGGILVLTGPVPGHWLLVAFTIAKNEILLLFFHKWGLNTLTLACYLNRYSRGKRNHF